ncbi:MAG: hypothetical protein CVU45_02225 [Chloroflexi bacterium HGW-Chloroflexi-7]|nr:MAG: hypothetical protein CVU45_02225 [Chloroflexi bacterium HGW-Chloroflexi-7]
MLFLRKSIFTLILIAFSLTACGKVSATQVPATTPEVIINTPQTIADLTTPTSLMDSEILGTDAPPANDYADCGAGGLIDVGYYFKDNNGDISPTQLVRFQKTSDEVRDYVAVITCLKNDEGWISDPDEVENGYENEIIFFDKNGRAHAYRIIIGGHYVAPYDPTHKDITGSTNGIDNLFYNVQEWIDVSRNQFVSNGSRQIGVDIYLDDTQGDLSKVLTQVYSFREINLQIAEALKTGEGYPDQVPEGFFLFATDSWLIQVE